MEVVIPVGVFHDDLHLGIHGLRRPHYQFASGICHQPQAVFRPTLAALGGYLVVVFQVDKEEVVENDVIEEFRGVFGDVLHHLPLVFTGVTVGLEVGGLRSGERDTAAYLQTLRQEKLLHLGECLLGHDERVAVGLEVDLVEVYLTAYRFPCGFQKLLVVHACHVLCTDVGRHFEVLVLAGLYGGSQ